MFYEKLHFLMKQAYVGLDRSAYYPGSTQMFRHKTAVDCHQYVIQTP